MRSLLILYVTIITVFRTAATCNTTASNATKRPNIVLIVADDMGWDDLSYHGSDQILTPNIDLLAYTGVALHRYYTHCVCTPSRAALLTGKFGYTTGMHGYPLTNGEDRGLPLDEKILPQYLKELGYSTHLVGKWHLGTSRTAYLPPYRGFDTYFGHRGGYIDYYDYTKEEYWADTQMVTGMDLFRNNTAAWDVEGYITDIYTNEAKSIITDHDQQSPLFLVVAHNAPHGGNDGAALQAPEHTIRTMRYIETSSRRLYAAVMKGLDDSVGDIVEALSNKGILDNTIIAFMADNGGMTTGNNVKNYASNWPLRGEKFTPFEGGIRVPGLIWSTSLSSGNHLWKGYMHVVDWLPTLLSAANGKVPEDIDGINLWDEIKYNNESSRNEIFEFGNNEYLAVISGDYKLVTGKFSEDTVTYSYHAGGDLRGIIGQAPSYANAIQNSKTYSMLKKLRIPVRKDYSIDRNRMTVDCQKNITEAYLCIPSNATTCLYNIKTDPCEVEELSTLQPEVVEKLKTRLQAEATRIKPRPSIIRDPGALPNKHNYTWTTWL